MFKNPGNTVSPIRGLLEAHQLWKHPGEDQGRVKLEAPGVSKEAKEAKDTPYGSSEWRKCFNTDKILSLREQCGNFQDSWPLR